ncbi:hypothetical protein LINPERPRIM_LOCUS24874 [Linum perenne]
MLINVLLVAGRCSKSTSIVFLIQQRKMFRGKPVAALHPSCAYMKPDTEAYNWVIQDLLEMNHMIG